MVDKQYLLDCPIQLQRITSYTTNSVNEQVPNWGNLGPRIMAERTFRNASENIKAQQVQATMVTRYVFRWSSVIGDFNPKDRLVDGSRTYEIKGVYEIGRKKYIEAHCVARVD